jgi:excisionase family DNA binding protein
MSNGLTVKQAAEILGFGLATVYEMVATGDLPAYRRGRAIRIDAAEIEAYKERNRVGPPAAPTVLFGRHFGLRIRTYHHAFSGYPAL